MISRRMAVATFAAILTGCAGAGIGLTPAVFTRSSASVIEARGGNTHVRFLMNVPRGPRHEREALHPSTISSLTQSVGIAVNGAKLHVFNATPSSKSCAVAAGRLACTFEVAAPAGVDMFLVRTYSAKNGGGKVLDEGKAQLKIVAGKKNVATVRLGPVVTTTADSGVGSLRYAVGSANPGDTILFLLPNSSTITLGSPITLSGKVTIAGPGVKTSALGAKTAYRGITLNGNDSQQIFVVLSGTTATISGLVFTHGTATQPHQPGGDVNNQGVLSLVGDAFTASTSIVQASLKVRRPIRAHACTNTYYQGGAVYNNGTLNVTGSFFDGNYVSSNFFGSSCLYGFGGALYNDQMGILTVTGSTFANNGAYQGGAVYNGATVGQATFTGDTFSANYGCTDTIGCPASCASMCTSFADGRGAAIFDAAGPGVLVTKSTFTGNVTGGSSAGSEGLGGALYLAAGTPKVTGSTFTSNVAGGGLTACSFGQGGAIFASVPLELDDDAFTKNRAGGDDGGDGGALKTADSVSGTGDRFTSNNAFGTGSGCAVNPFGTGGAISAGVKVTIGASTFEGNSAIGLEVPMGGAIAATNASLIGNSFTNNYVQLTGGGAVFARGGAVQVSGTLTMSGNTFTGNSVAEPSGTGGKGLGGAVFSAQLSSTGDTFKSNAASANVESDGGALDVTGQFVISKDTFTSNVSTAGISLGGGLYAGAVGNVNNSTFTSNVAGSSSLAGYGGGIYDLSGIQLSGSTLTSNVATSGGGGLFNLASDSVTNSILSGNKVTAAQTNYGGGGIYSGGGTLLTDSTISGNTVAVVGTNAGGGGLYNLAGLTMTGTTISGNSVTGTASGSGGGGMFDDSDDFMSNDTIAGNNSSIDGGGYESSGNHVVNISNVTFYQNKAAGLGGNIANPGSIALFGSIVAGGAAAGGPDLYSTGTFFDNDYNLFQQSGLATGHDLTANPKLLPLSNNGGPTLTLADQATSPGRGHIPGGSCILSTDQRHFTRGAGGVCDIGAYEYAGIATALNRRK